MKNINHDKKFSNVIDLRKSTEKNFCASIFQTVEIDDEIWMTENLNVSHYINGEPIIEAKTNEEWNFCALNRIPAYCYYGDDDSNESDYGKLYNYYCLTDKRKLVPNSFQIIDKLPLNRNLSELFNHPTLNVSPHECIRIENIISAINIKASGYRFSNGQFSNLNKEFRCWSKPSVDRANGFYHSVKFSGVGINLSRYLESINTSLGNGYSIRCKKIKLF